MKKTKPDLCLVIVNYQECLKAFYLRFLQDVIKKKIPIIILPAYETENKLISMVNLELKSLKFIGIKRSFKEYLDDKLFLQEEYR